MREYTFISKGRAEGIIVDVDLPKKISAISLKKAIAKFSPKELCTMAVIYWTSRKGNESKKVIAMPYINRKQRKGRLQMINILLVIGILIIGILAIMGMKATGAL